MVAAKSQTELQAYVIPNMVQGVSQQTAQQRRDTQCEEQFDCINSPVNGCEARPGFDFLKKAMTGVDLTDAFQYEIFRGDTEHYLVVVAQTAYGAGTPRKLHVYDLNTGNECAVTFTDDESYLTPTEVPRLAYFATSLNDTSFIGNRNKRCLMSTSNKSPPKKNEAIIFWKAGAYLITYQCAIHYNGKVYTWTYTTPDNSTVANGPYIATNQIAAAFFRSFTGVKAVVSVSGTTVADANVRPAEPCTISIASPGVITKTAHNLVPDQLVAFYTTGALPTGLTANQMYYVKTVIDADHFTVAATQGGAAINTSGTQSGIQTLASFDVAGGVGAVGDGTTGGVGTNTGGTTLTSLGFYVRLNGNCILIGRYDNADFEVDCGDGVGNTYMRAIKDTAQAFDELPNGCFVGFTTKVVGTNRQTQDDYYVQFQGADGTSGYWEEVVAPGVSLTPDATTMPYILVNTGVNTFEWKKAPWGQRVSGDGVDSAKDPSFIGQYLRDISFDHSRLCLMWEGGSVWSRTRNPYVFFPDTAQTGLDTDPIDIKPGGGKTIALLRRIIQIAEAVFLWAEKIQFRANSGVNPFKADTVEAPASTNYEFAPNAIPKAVGQSLYFASEPGPFATIRDLAIQDGKPAGAVDITAHVKKYIPSGVRWIAASDTLGVLMVSSLGDASKLYVYNYVVNQQQRVQSAWNIWRLPPQSKILWLSISLNYVYLLVQRGTDEALILKCDLSVDRQDADAGADYLTRMDFMCTEAQVSMSYNTGTDKTTITLPYKPLEGDGYDGSTPDTCPLFVANRVSSANFVRGRVWPITSITASTRQVVVQGNCTAESLYIGYRIKAEREMSRFYVKSPKGLVPTKRLQVKNFNVNYAKTGYFRADVTYGSEVQSYYMTGRIFGDPNNVYGKYAISEGSFPVPVDSENDKYKLRLVNDSFLPSAWTGGSYDFVAAYISRPTSYGEGQAQ